MRRGPTVAAHGRAVAAILTATYEGWRDDRCARLGAGLAYYGLFALVPVLLLAVAMADIIFSAAEVQAALAEPLARLLDRDAEELAGAMAEAFAGSDVGSGLGVVGLVSTLVAASLVFVALQDAFNVIWQVPYQAGLRRSLRRRLLSLAVVLGIGLVVVVSLAAQAVIGLLGDFLPMDHALVNNLTDAVVRLVPLLVGGTALALLFALLPPVPVDRRAAAVAGVTTVVALALGAVGVGVYLQRFGANSAQQAAGSVFVVLTGIYVESQILLAGAELTKVLTDRWAKG